MPIVDISQLRQESMQLAELFEDPKEFVRQLDRLLDKYATRGKRRGKVKKNISILRSYDVPNTVLRQLRLELFKEMQLRPEQSLELLDALWERKVMEHRLLAARLLGALPHEAFDEVCKRVIAWAEENRDERLLEEIAERGTKSLREQDPKTLVDLAASLFERSDLRPRAVGLLAIKALLDQSSLVNLPAILDLLGELSNDPPKDLRPYLLDLYASLIDHSPGEATFFLQERLANDPSEGTLWLARQTLKLLGPDRAQVLQEALDLQQKE